MPNEFQNEKSDIQQKTSIFTSIPWKKLVILVILVGSFSGLYLYFQRDIHWFLVERPEEKKLQLQYHLFGRHPIPEPLKGNQFVSTSVFDRTEQQIAEFIEGARQKKNSLNKIESSSPNLLFFSGPSGIGKSSSLVKIANEYLKKRGWYVYYYDLSSIFKKFKVADCLNVIDSATTNHKDSTSMRSKMIGSNTPENVQKKKFEKYIRSLEVLLQNNKEVLIIFDGLHVFDQQPQIKILMGEFMKLVEKGAYLVGAGLNTEVLDYMGAKIKSARKNLWQIETHDKISQKELRRYTKSNFPNLRKPEIERLVNLSDAFREIRSLVKMTDKDIQKLKKSKVTTIKQLLKTNPEILQDLCQLCMKGQISEDKSTRILLKNNIAEDLQSWETRITRMIFEENFINLCPWKAGQKKQCYDHRDYEVKSQKLSFQQLLTEPHIGQRWQVSQQIQQDSQQEAKGKILGDSLHATEKVSQTQPPTTRNKKNVKQKGSTASKTQSPKPAQNNFNEKPTSRYTGKRPAKKATPQNQKTQKMSREMGEKLVVKSKVAKFQIPRLLPIIFNKKGQIKRGQKPKFKQTPQLRPGNLQQLYVEKENLDNIKTKNLNESQKRYYRRIYETIEVKESKQVNVDEKQVVVQNNRESAQQVLNNVETNSQYGNQYLQDKLVIAAYQQQGLYKSSQLVIQQNKQEITKEQDKQEIHNQYVIDNEERKESRDGQEINNNTWELREDYTKPQSNGLIEDKEDVSEASDKEEALEEVTNAHNSEEGYQEYQRPQENHSHQTLSEDDATKQDQMHDSQSLMDVVNQVSRESSRQDDKGQPNSTQDSVETRLQENYILEKEETPQQQKNESDKSNQQIKINNHQSQETQEWQPDLDQQKQIEQFDAFIYTQGSEQNQEVEHSSDEEKEQDKLQGQTSNGQHQFQRMQQSVHLQFRDKNSSQLTAQQYSIEDGQSFEISESNQITTVPITSISSPHEEIRTDIVQNNSKENEKSQTQALYESGDDSQYPKNTTQQISDSTAKVY